MHIISKTPTILTVKKLKKKGSFALDSTWFILLLYTITSKPLLMKKILLPIMFILFLASCASSVSIQQAANKNYKSSRAIR